MKKILINEDVWQTRIAITRDGLLQNVYFAGHSEHPLERVFFKGIVTKVLPGIQTAFVDIGQEKAGFLHISEIDRDLAIERISKQIQVDDEEEAPVSRMRQKIDISKIFKEGDQILVQVSKEPVYEKGAKLSTCFTLPGRFIVLMPNIPRIGVSKKIENRDERNRLKDIVKSALPEGMGAIIRTTSEERSAKDIGKDIAFLLETWQNIQKKFTAAKPKERIYEDIELPLQIVRDHLDDDVEAVITDSKESQSKIYKFIKSIAPEYTSKVHYYDGASEIFDFYGIEKQINAGLEKKVPLKSGGSLIIETTEAMTVIDVNTGRFTGKKNLEETILATNLEAAEETVRQLRLRNIGGLIVIDFIDMSVPSNRQKLFNFFEKNLRERDKFQSVVLKISEFGLVQMTRKRSGITLYQQLTQRCQTCRGQGFIMSLETETQAVLRALKAGLKSNKYGSQVQLVLSPDIFKHVTSVEYNAILALEKAYRCKITLISEKDLHRHQYKIEKK
ncbi:ribonuclease G [Candidatus Dependentiae bacterium Noda2021]|nr:ribonuclease G [Candidatus Dependentiae bacterium Noda2021]